ncbi:unnamed protein product [Zymoseptoria tritici ST99CH_1A5]|uniref:ER membrane protein complex subunit 7 beta-sandwich domain-containing protein n=1 Tax=Zymoseptoria tritici ST99CH_1A5 TaxID=1276529 RepID=A0A1Y6LVN2_ZYMTR|nr:unnamed protein product [Zymoseptoria tritici ST99CH_1A5]
MRSLITALLGCAVLTSAANLTVSIPPSQQLPNPAVLPPSTHAVLLGPPGVRYDAPIRRDNTFIFTDLDVASYLLTLHTRDFFFVPLRVDVSQPAVGEESQLVEAWQTFRGNEWSNKGPSYGTGKGALTVQMRPSAPKEYYQERGGFSLLGFFKNPMILMGLFSVVLIVGMPYLMDNMDPEMKEEFEELQKKSPLGGGTNVASQLQNFDMASWMAGKPAESGSSKKK